VARDDRRAADLWSRAAEGGRDEARFNLAIALERGIGVERDATRAFALYECIAARGDANALYEVGRCAYYGIGTPLDRDAADAWFVQARACGHAEAACDAAEGDGPRRIPRPNVAGPFHATRGG
jgi:TPR repeat protein